MTVQRLFTSLAVVLLSVPVAPALASAASGPHPPTSKRNHPSQAPSVSPQAVTVPDPEQHAPAHLGTAISTSGAAPKTGDTANLKTSSTPLRAVVATLFAAINRDRQAHSLPALTLDARQSRCSRRHSAHMATQNAISHDQFPADVCVPYRHTAENVGMDSLAPAGSVIAIHRAMMDEGPCPSPCTGAAWEAHGHYLNLLNPLYTRVGIGVVVKDGRTWLTEDFT